MLMTIMKYFRQVFKNNCNIELLFFQKKMSNDNSNEPQSSNSGFQI